MKPSVLLARFRALALPIALAVSVAGLVATSSGRSLLTAPTAIEDLRVQEITLTPVQQWAGGGGANLPIAIDDWVPDGIQDHSFIVIRGADNEGSRITGIDSTGIAPGSIRWFVNLPTGASVPTDSGTVTFLHDSTSSLAANRIQTPGKMDCTFPVYSVFAVLYGGLDMDGVNRWRIISECGWVGAGRMATQMLSLYPNCAVGNPTPISGTFDDWRPTCYTPFTPGFWIAGATTDSWEYSVFNVYVDAGGATLTGLYTSATQTDNRAHGPVKVIRNMGPGPLTLKHLDGDSSVNLRFVLPQERDLILKKNEAVILYSPFNNAVDLAAQWFVLSLGASNEVFPSIMTAGTTELDGALEFGGITTPAALGAGTTQNYNPGSRNLIWRLTANAAGSALGGIVAPTLGHNEIHIIQNIGSGPLTFNYIDGGSTGANQFTTPRALPLSIASNGAVLIRYDFTIGTWVVLSWVGDAFGVRSSTTATTTNCFPTWTDTNGTLSSSCSTSDNGSTVTIGSGRLVTMDGSTTFSQTFAAPGSIVDQPYWTSRLVPAALTSGSSNDNWNPTGIHTKVWIAVQTSTGSLATLTGINQGGSGELKVLCNFGTGPVKLVHNATSTAANRFTLSEGIDITIPVVSGKMYCVGFRYDSSDTRWEQTWQNFSGANPATPAASACGGAGLTLSTNCSNQHCTVTTGAGAAGCTLTFGNSGYTNAPTCTVSAQNGVIVQYTVSATAVTLGTGTAAGALYDVICDGG